MAAHPQTDPELLNLPDAGLLFFERFDTGYDDRLLLRQLLEEIQWRQERITLFGRKVLQPRLVAWYGDAGASYTYSGVRHEPLPWTGLLRHLRSRVEAAVGTPFNSVLLNLYRDHRDAMGLHADDEPELGPEPVIASLSLGAQRTLYFRHRSRRDLDTFNLLLPSGSLLVMQGSTQKNWKHGLRRLSRPCGPRVNLTFRRTLDA